MQTHNTQKQQQKENENRNRKFPFPDKSNSPTHRIVSVSDIRVTRTTNGSGNISNAGGSQQTPSATTATVQPEQQNNGNSGGGVGCSTGQSTGNNTTTGSNTTIVTIKQESLANVDSLVGSFVDSTTFLHSPNSQMVTPNLVQNSIGGGGSSAGEEYTIYFSIYLILYRRKLF